MQLACHCAVHPLVQPTPTVVLLLLHIVELHALVVDELGRHLRDAVHEKRLRVLLLELVLEPGLRPRRKRIRARREQIGGVLAPPLSLEGWPRDQPHKHRDD